MLTAKILNAWIGSMFRLCRIRLIQYIALIDMSLRAII